MDIHFFIIRVQSWTRSSNVYASLNKELAYLTEIGEIYVEQVIEPLTRENVCLAFNCCGMKNEQITKNISLER